MVTKQSSAITARRKPSNPAKIVKKYTCPIKINKFILKIYLTNVVCKCYNFALCLDVPQHIWDGDGNETDVYKGQIGEEEVFGGGGGSQS